MKGTAPSNGHPAVLRDLRKISQATATIRSSAADRARNVSPQKTPAINAGSRALAPSRSDANAQYQRAATIKSVQSGSESTMPAALTAIPENPQRAVTIRDRPEVVYRKRTRKR